MENENPFEDGWVSNNNRFVDSNGNTTYVDMKNFSYTDSMVRDWNKNIENDTQHLNMISLYDYFGKAVGSIMGRETYRQSVKQGVKSYKKSFARESNQVVRVYPKAWLEMFFGSLEVALELVTKKEN